MPEWNTEKAEWYAANYGEYATNMLAVDELDLNQNSSIVDVGCGTGAALRHAALKVTDGNLIGVDPVPRMVEIARERTADHPAAGRIEYRTGSAEDLPVDNIFADYVFAFDSLDHWQDVGLGLSEVRRILQPSGLFVLVKDKGVPGAKEGLRTLSPTLIQAGFIFVHQQEINTDELCFALWISTACE